MNTTEQSNHKFEGSYDDTSTRGSKANPLECNICFEDSFEPVVTPCGHIYCWGCIYKWLKAKEQNNYCPVCNAVFTQEKLIPIYSKNEKPGTRKHNDSIPKRPKPEREERQRTNENAGQRNFQNQAGDFFNRMYFGGGFGFGNLFFSGINFRTRNMSLNIATLPILITMVFPLLMNLLSIFISTSPHHHNSMNVLSLWIHIILLVGFLFLGTIIKKIMR